MNQIVTRWNHKGHQKQRETKTKQKHDTHHVWWERAWNDSFSLRFDSYFWIACCFIFCCSLLSWRSIVETLLHVSLTHTRVCRKFGREREGGRDRARSFNWCWYDLLFGYYAETAGKCVGNSLNASIHTRTRTHAQRSNDWSEKSISLSEGKKNQWIQLNG